MPPSLLSDDDPQQLAHLLEALINAGSWDESRRVVEQHPELLGKEAEILLEQIGSAQPDAETVQVLQEHRELLGHCRDVGIARAFAEKQLPAEALVEAQRRGLSPEEVLAQLRAAQQMPAELREVLAELAAGGIEIRTAEELEQALVARPDLRAKLEDVVQAADNRPAVPPEFADDLRTAQESVQRYLGTGDRAALDSAAAAWSRILKHAAFSSVAEGFRLAALHSAGGVFWRRYWAGGRLDDLNRALELWQQAVEATPPDSPDLPMYLSNLGIGLSDRFRRTGQEADLDEAIRMFQQAVEATPPDSADYSGCLINLGTGLSDRFRRTGQEADLDEAIRMFQQAVEATPPDSPDLPMYLSNLGTGLSDRFRRTRQEADLDEAIRVYQQAVEATLPNSLDLLGYLSNLGNGLRDRFRRTGQAADLDEAIRVYQQAVEATPPDSPNFPECLTDLGIGLRDRFARTGQQADLDEAIRVFEQALGAMPSDSPDLSGCLTDLGGGLCERFRRTGQQEDLDEGIRVLKQAADATPPDSPGLSGHLTNLSIGLQDRFRRTGQQTDLEEAIRVLKKAIEATSVDSPDLPIRLTDLGSCLQNRFRRTGQQTDLEEAIRVLKRAIEAMPDASPAMPESLNNLGICLHDRFRRTGQREDLEESIRVLEGVVEATPADSAALLRYYTNLGSSLRERFRCKGQQTDLEEAIRVFKWVLEATSADSPHLPGHLMNLGVAIHDRFGWTRKQGDLEEAVRILEQVVEATPPDSPDLPEHLFNFGRALHDRFELTGQSTDMEKAIRVLKLVRETTPLGSPDLPAVLSVLGSCLCESFRSTEQQEDLEEAIWALKQAREAEPRDSRNFPDLLASLGLCLHDRFRCTGQESDLEEAIRALEQAIDATPPDSPNFPSHLTNLGIFLHDRFVRTGQEIHLERAIQACRRACELGSDPRAVLFAARKWGYAVLKREQWAETAEAYGYGLATGRKLLARQLLREHKENSLRDLQLMSEGAAYALGKLGQYREAATVMEGGRARLLADVLQRRRRELGLLPALGHEDVYERYRDIVNREEELTRSAANRIGMPNPARDLTRLQDIEAAHQKFEEVVAEIQQIPGYSDFLQDANFAQVRAATADAPLCYLLATPAGGLALVVGPQSVQPVWLDSLTEERVLEWLNGTASDPKMGGWLDTYQNWLIERTQRAHQAWLTTIDGITHQLWIHIMQPLAAALRQVKLSAVSNDSTCAPMVTLIPTGGLALLPLHAAWTEDAFTPTRRRYFMDEFIVNYAPSALALAHALGRAEMSSTERFLAVEEPRATGASALPNVHAEVAAIAALFDNPVILAYEKATRQAVLDALPKADVVHFSCHGSNDWQSPLDSGLLMADDDTGEDVMLTVRDLLSSAQTGGRLATLSACETGIVGTKLPDEVVALPSALLQAGYGGVVASLWSVADISTTMLMEYFYAGWRKKGGNKLSPAQALRAAQIWLRDTTNKEKADYFKRYSHELSTKLRMPEADAIKLYGDFMSRYPDARDFTHPFWWAAFYLTGV